MRNPDPSFALLILLAAALSACASTGAVPRPFPGAPGPAAPDERAKALPRGMEPAAPGEAAADIAESQAGAPYRSGGADPAGFDCSGLVQYAYARAGASLPRSVRAQWAVGQPVDREDLRRGDLVFFAIAGREVSHVGIALDAARFVHAPSSRGVVRVDSLGAEYWASRYAGARRVTGPSAADAGGRVTARTAASPGRTR